MDTKTVFKQQQDYYKLGYTKSVTFREMMLDKLLKSLKNSEKDILIALEKDLGNSFTEGYTTEVGMVYSSINKTIKNLNKWSKPKKKKTAFYLPFAKSYVNSIAFGNVLIMSAFNYPVLLSLDPLIGAIAAGNTAMLALPKTTPNVNKVLINMLDNTFDSAYVYAFVTDRQINDQILTYKFNKIFYTGSSKVAKIVAKAAAENLIPTTLELGGKSPALLTKNAKIKTITKSIVWGKLLNAGQTCVAPDYILVDKFIAEDVINEINTSAKVMYGDNFENSTDYSKIVNEKELERLVKLADQDQDYVINQWTYNLEKRFMGLVILKANLEDVDKLASMQSEIFGPILPIIVYNDLDAAIDYINSQDTPLAFYPFSTKKYEVDYLLEEVRFGGATVNDTILHLSNLDLPFGGLGNSGMGNYHGKYSFDTFSHKQSILKTKSSFKNQLMYPPYSKFKDRLIRLFLK